MPLANLLARALPAVTGKAIATVALNGIEEVCGELLLAAGTVFESIYYHEQIIERRQGRHKLIRTDPAFNDHA